MRWLRRESDYERCWASEGSARWRDKGARDIRLLARTAGAALLVLVLAIIAMSTPSPAVASGYTPEPPSGWQITAITDPSWSGGFRLGDGVLAVITAPADPRAFEAYWDIYRLDDSWASGPATTVLRSYIRGLVSAVDRGLILYGSKRPGTDPDQGILDLYVRDLGSGAVTKLPMPSNLELNPNGPPRLDRGRVVWSQFGFHHEPEIMLYDVGTGTVRRLSEGDEAQGAPDIDGDDVVWQAWNGVRHRIVYYDLSVGTRRELATGIPWTADLSPLEANGRAVWVTHEWITPQEDRTSLYLADLATGTTQLVFSTPGSIEFALDDDLLVTSTRIGDEPVELVVRDLSSGTTRALGDSLDPPLSFSVEGGMVAWEDVTALPGGAGYLNRIMVYDSATGETVEVAQGVGLWQPKVDRGRVVFSEWIDPESSRIWLAEKDGVPLYDFYLDAPANDRYADAIIDFSERGFVSGYVTETFRTFHPRYPLLRAQLAKILTNSLDLSVDESMALPTPFTDLGADNTSDLYPHEYVAAVSAAGLMQGYSARAFGPWDRLTRAQMVTVVVRALRKLVPNTMETPPMGYVGSVTGAPAVHAENLRVAEFNGLLDDLDGYGSDWDPNAFARRGEVIQMLYGVRTKLSEAR